MQQYQSQKQTQIQQNNAKKTIKVGKSIQNAVILVLLLLLLLEWRVNCNER